MITKLEELITAVKGRPKKRIVVAYAQDAHTIEAVNAAVDMGIVEPGYGQIKRVDTPINEIASLSNHQIM